MSDTKTDEQRAFEAMEARESTPDWAAARKVVHKWFPHCNGHADHFGCHVSECKDATAEILSLLTQVREEEREACARMARWKQDEMNRKAYQGDGVRVEYLNMAQVAAEIAEEICKHE